MKPPVNPEIHLFCARVMWSPTPAAQNLLAFSADPGVAFDF